MQVWGPSALPRGRAPGPVGECEVSQGCLSLLYRLYVCVNRTVSFVSSSSPCHGLFRCHADLCICFGFILKAVFCGKKQQQINVQCDKGYFLCCVFSCGVLSAFFMNVKAVTYTRQVTFVSDGSLTGKEEILITVTHLSPKGQLSDPKEEREDRGQRTLSV